MLPDFNVNSEGLQRLKASKWKNTIFSEATHNTVAMEDARARINRGVIRSVVSEGGGGRAIKHPDFQDNHPALFSDNTHLSFIGNDIFLNSFQGAFETFLNYPNVKVYPVE